MASFNLAAQAPVQQPSTNFSFDSREVHPRHTFRTKNVEDCAKIILVGLPSNPHRLTQLWTLLYVAMTGGASAGAAALEVLLLWKSYGMNDNADTAAVALAAMRDASLAAGGAQVPGAGIADALLQLLQVFGKQKYPHAAVTILGNPDDPGARIAIRPPILNMRFLNYSKLGSGFFGSVQKAETARSLWLEEELHQGKVVPQFVAIKEIDIGTLVSRIGDSEGLVRFESKLQREIANMRCINHPNIVGLLNFCSVQPNLGRPWSMSMPPEGQSPAVGRAHHYAGSKLYLTMELCPGRELFSEVVDGTISPECLLVALSKVGRALQYLHAASIVHRDVKPENIGYYYQAPVLGQSAASLNDAIICKLFDFGLSKQIGTTPSQMGYTAETGTPLFRAPEISSNSQGGASSPTAGGNVHGLKADVYSLGITIAVCYGKEHPVIDQQTGEIDFNLCRRMNRREEVQILPDRQYGNYPATWQRCSTDMKHLVSQMTRHDPDARPSMAQAMAHQFWGDYRVLSEEKESIDAAGKVTAQHMASAPPIPELF